MFIINMHLSMLPAPPCRLRHRAVRYVNKSVREQNAPCVLYKASGNMFLRNVLTHLPEYTISHPRRQRVLCFWNLTTLILKTACPQ